MCQHFQCFDIANYIGINKNQTSTWRCPICKKRSVEIIRDQLFESVTSFVQAMGISA
jgi:hypothetical protein